MSKTRINPLIIVFLLGSFLVLSLLLNQNGTQLQLPKEYAVISKNQIVKLQIEGGWLTVRVLDAATHKPIQGVYVEIDWMFTGPGWDWSLETDGDGKAVTAVPFGDYKFQLSHSNYETLQAGPYTVNNPQTNLFTFYMTQKGDGGEPPVGKVKVTFYFRDANNEPVSIGFVFFEDISHRATPEGKVILFEVPVGTQTFRFKGEYYTGTIEWNKFDFTTQLTIPEHDESYSVWVAQKLVETGIPPAPPPPPPNPWDIWTFIIRYGWILLTVAVILYVLPHIASLARTIKGK